MPSMLPAGAGPGILALLVLSSAACSPAMNWREVRTGAAGIHLMLPCKPERAARPLRLAGVEVVMTLQACRAADVTWALAETDLGDPRRSAAALAELQAAARANLGAGPARVLELGVPGATPHPASTRLAFSGRLPDGGAVQVQLALFVKGTRVYQATCVGTQLPQDAVETFFGGLRADG